MRALLYLLFLTGLATAGELRVMSYNIHHGVGMDGKLDLQRIAGIIKKEKPDLVALQEVDQSVPRSGKVDQAEALARLLGMKHIFRKCIDLHGGAYGNAVLSKHPIDDVVVHRLPGKGEPRIALEVQVMVGRKRLSFCSVHFDWTTEAVRLLQAKSLETHLAKRKHPVLLLGDFNARPESQTMQYLARTWSIVPKKEERLTCPANKPRDEIDYILTLGLDASKASCRVLPEAAASDHRPLFGRISLP
ncbi:MAG: endonuclease/exonuclease/phosphatase family protein [Akkermansiaceae bacterium]|nr:endonuclease/exonuclease/phosphatase family protein [Akkermansiaceae bacterium]